jgi:hypothetical protein
MECVDPGHVVARHSGKGVGVGCLTCVCGGCVVSMDIRWNARDVSLLGFRRLPRANDELWLLVDDDDGKGIIRHQIPMEPYDVAVLHL